MRKISLFLLLLCTLTLFACSSSNTGMVLLDDIDSISISESQGYGGLNENYLKTYDEPEIIEVFEDIIKNAKETNQVVSKSKPDYDIYILYKNGGTHGLHLIIEEENSMLMYIGHDNIFHVSLEDAKVLISMTDGITNYD